MTTRSYNALYIISFILLCLASGSFVWFYKYPLNADIPVHSAVATAFIDLLGDKDTSIYPYILNIKFSTYAIPELILALIIKLFGLGIGTKVALSLYAIAFPVSVGYLVSSINPDSRWTKFIGFPITLNYFFHWGFWPSLLGTIMAVLSIAFSIRYDSGKKGIWINSGSRTLTMLMHPAPLLALIFYDFIVILIDIRNNNKWLNPLKWNWKKMIMIWGIPFIAISIMIIGEDNSGRIDYVVIWGSIKSQLVQAFRPLFVTSNIIEFMPQLILGAIFTFVVIRETKNQRKHAGIILTAIFLIIFGALLPRDRFLGNSWEIGARIVFMGWILLFAIWSICENKLRYWIIIWILLAFCINLTVSHMEWNKYENSYQNAFREIAAGHDAGKIITRVIYDNPGSPTTRYGKHLASWIWCENKALDVYNVVAHINSFGPVKYIGIDSMAILSRNQYKTYTIIYHPFINLPAGRHNMDSLIYEDSIYTIYKAFGNNPIKPIPPF